MYSSTLLNYEVIVMLCSLLVAKTLFAVSGKRKSQILNGITNGMYLLTGIITIGVFVNSLYFSFIPYKESEKFAIIVMDLFK